MALETLSQPGSPPPPALPRRIPEAPEGEDEESEGPLREQDLKEAYIPLVRGLQEWQDGCIYRGEFGLDMKLGYWEFSWPTGEVTASFLPRLGRLRPGPLLGGCVGSCRPPGGRGGRLMSP